MSDPKRMSRRILYIGRFYLPDKNAAAHRALSNAKALSELGCDVIFLYPDPDMKEDNSVITDIQGFKCIRIRDDYSSGYLIKIGHIIRLIESESIDTVIAYNYPAIALIRLCRYARKHGIKLIGDVSEWYVSSRGYIFKYIKNIDTSLRMKHVHKKTDALIVISSYLYDYYSDVVKTVEIPPLVDLREPKWSFGDDQSDREEKNDVLKLCYAGSPALIKERLDIIVKAVNNLSEKINVELSVAGITEEQYCSIYSDNTDSDRIRFLGSITHDEVIKLTRDSDWSIILRDDNLVVRAGFPTKVVESISCGTPVIANRFSNICDYLDDSNSIIIDSFDEVEKAIAMAAKKKPYPDRELFDYHNYIDRIKTVIE